MAQLCKYKDKNKHCRNVFNKQISTYKTKIVVLFKIVIIDHILISNNTMKILNMARSVWLSG